MSRRRAPKAESWFPERPFISIVCTGRRRHAEVSFGRVRLTDDGRITPDAFSRIVGDDFASTDWEAGVVNHTVTIVCKRCTPTRNVPLKLTTLEEICQGLIAHDTLRLDVSSLSVLPAKIT